MKKYWWFCIAAGVCLALGIILGSVCLGCALGVVTTILCITIPVVLASALGVCTLVWYKTDDVTTGGVDAAALVAKLEPILTDLLDNLGSELVDAIKAIEHTGGDTAPVECQAAKLVDSISVITDAIAKLPDHEEFVAGNDDIIDEVIDARQQIKDELATNVIPLLNVLINGVNQIGVGIFGEEFHMDATSPAYLLELLGKQIQS